MTRHALVLAAASVALGTVALNGQVPTTAPVATPPLLSAPSNAPSVTPAPSTTPTASGNNRDVVMPGVAGISASTNPTATVNERPPVITRNPANTTLTPSARGLSEQLPRPAGSTINRSGLQVNNGSTGTTAGGTLQGIPTTQPSLGSTATGEQAIPSGSRLDNDTDDLLLHPRTSEGATQGSGLGRFVDPNRHDTFEPATGQQAVPAGSSLDTRDDLLNNNNATGGSLNSSQGTRTTPNNESLPGVPGPRRFVDPNRHDAFQPAAPQRTPAPSVTPNSSGGAAAPAPAPQPGNTGK